MRYVITAVIDHDPARAGERRRMLSTLNALLRRGAVEVQAIRDPEEEQDPAAIRVEYRVWPGEEAVGMGQ